VVHPMDGAGCQQKIDGLLGARSHGLTVLSRPQLAAITSERPSSQQGERSLRGMSIAKFAKGSTLTIKVFSDCQEQIDGNGARFTRIRDCQAEIAWRLHHSGT
jgi:hypothetical protein